MFHSQPGLVSISKFEFICTATWRNHFIKNQRKTNSSQFLPQAWTACEYYLYCLDLQTRTYWLWTQLSGSCTCTTAHYQNPFIWCGIQSTDQISISLSSFEVMWKSNRLFKQYTCTRYLHISCLFTELSRGHHRAPWHCKYLLTSFLCDTDLYSFLFHIFHYIIFGLVLIK